MKKNKVLLVVILAIPLIVFITLFFLKLLNISSTNYDMEALSQVSGAISYGVFSNNRIIDTGSTIETYEINHVVDISQNLSASRIYKLIMFVDFVQYEFSVEGKKYTTYDFELNNIDDIKIPILAKLPENSKELCYLIIKKPYYSNDEKDLEKALILQEVLPLRFKIKDGTMNINYCSNITNSNEGPIPEIFFTLNPNKLKPVYTLYSESKNYLIHGNSTSEEMSYATIQLVNWEQTNWADGEKVKYFKVAENEKVIMKTIAPTVQKNEIIQYITFPYPFEVSRKNLYSTTAFGSFRANLLKEN